MLGIGSTELVLILFFGFLLFGPEKLPEMGRIVGKAIRQFRQASDDVNKKFKEEVYDPFQEAIDPYKSELEGSMAPFKDDIKAINQTFNETKQVLKDPLNMKGMKKDFQNTLKGKKDDESSPTLKVASVATSTAAASAVADPFADSEPAAAPQASIANSLYGLDDAKDGE